MSLSKKRRVVAKAGVWIAALTPALWLAWDFRRGHLSVNPIEDILDRLGWWGLVFIILTLAITPIRKLTGWHSIVRFRRLVGLFAFFYVSLHLSAYVALDQWFAFATILEDIARRPFITVGFGAWLILLALAVTSTRGWIRRLGKNWRRLHRLVYLAAGLGAIHFYWNVKADTREPWLFIAILAALLLFRTPTLGGLALRTRRKRNRPASPISEPPPHGS
jgi:sulfoxide reductase heme-binding subunit YedZ